MFSHFDVLMRFSLRVREEKKTRKGWGMKKGKRLVFPWGDNRGVKEGGMGGTIRGDGRGKGGRGNRFACKSHECALMRMKMGVFWGVFAIDFALKSAF